MDETLKLIELAHQGDKAARDRLVTDNPDGPINRKTDSGFILRRI